MSLNLDDLLKMAVQSNASDLHIKVGSYPMMRVHGSLYPASEEKRLGLDDTEGMAATILSPTQQQKFREHQEVDLAYSVPGLGRFRCNVFRQRSTVGIVLRVIPTRINSIDELNLPPVLKKIADEERGLVLVTGTTGTGLAQPNRKPVAPVMAPSARMAPGTSSVPTGSMCLSGLSVMRPS